MQDSHNDDIDVLRNLPLTELMSMALRAKLTQRGDRFSLCSIINAKSGKCSEDCRFCAQSGHYKTDCPVYPLKSRDEIIRAAFEAKEVGAEHFSIVTVGRGLPEEEVETVAGIVEKIVERVGIKVCASLGILSKPALKRLKDAGLVRYHHNLETSREFFPKVVTTHTFADRLATIRAAGDAGLEVCAGGILGLGESEDDRISMALTLKEYEVDSVPLNILMPLPGTPMAGKPVPTISEILRAIALYRLILPNIPIRLAAGRGGQTMDDFLGMAFMAGADGMMIGGYLTQGCRPPEEDQRFVAAMQALWTLPLF